MNELIWLILRFNFSFFFSTSLVFFTLSVLLTSTSHLNSKLVLALRAHKPMLTVIQEYWVSLSGDKSDRLICPVRGWGGNWSHLTPQPLPTVGTRGFI